MRAPLIFQPVRAIAHPMNTIAAKPEWIAVDWGTSHLRAWAMQGDTAIAETDAGTGMGSLAPDEFETALLALVEPWLSDKATPVVACGMVGARQGWCEAAYTKVPCPPVGPGKVQPQTTDPRLDVTILPGLSQDTPADVMRGEETQIAGYLANDPKFDGILCLPGTHTKWVHISAEEVVSFRTFMTGELFALLSENSVLRHSVDDAWDTTAFTQAVHDGMGRPAAIASNLFSLRADDVMNGSAPGIARARLSGLLIGAELAAAKPYWLGQRVVLIGQDKLSSLYATALAPEGVEAEIADGTAITLAGLTSAYLSLKDAT